MPSYVAVPTPPEIIAIVVRAAAEGIPVAAIARIVRLPYDRTLLYLQRARRLGALLDVPRADWPALESPQDRRPASSRHPAPPDLGATVPVTRAPAPLPAEDVEFLCRQTFRLTSLEAGFLAVLLRCLFAEKEKLHAVIEQQRASRPVRPDKQEVTDVKMVDVMICKLRKKMHLVDDAIAIRTSWGKGYFLDQATKDHVYRMLARGMADLSGPTPPTLPPGAGERSAHAGQAAP